MGELARISARESAERAVGSEEREGGSGITAMEIGDRLMPKDMMRTRRGRANSGLLYRKCGCVT